MGVTIFYKGKLNHPDLTSDFLEEMADIAKAMGWDYKTFNDSNKLQELILNGIIIYPHKESETLDLIVDQKGYLRNIITLKYVPEKPGYSYQNFIKTQFAPVEIHVAVIKLFRYIQKKYISNLKIFDEGNYWDTADADILKEKIDFLNEKIMELGAAFASIKIKEGESPESIADKIEQILSEKYTKGNPPDHQQ